MTESLVYDDAVTALVHGEHVLFDDGGGDISYYGSCHGSTCII